ncbi:hypothetical protein F2Q69_00010950 [Brassica cretica]|uniref:COG complex component COG2 C-terminal domain-containing protein n=1 Tax=Brassica cretica TaxID=69181 RepID=A0A8S9QYI0_BRACR|nr:hypothetical protein F2Q69_00010950 [Brassica cretica]
MNVHRYLIDGFSGYCTLSINRPFWREKATRYLTQETREELLLRTVTEITRRYYELADEVVSVARRTESSLQQFRRKAQKRAGAASGVSDDNVSETDKMCMQLFLDTQEYGRNISALGLKPADIPVYCSFWQCVAPADWQNTKGGKPVMRFSKDFCVGG